MILVGNDWRGKLRNLNHISVKFALTDSVFRKVNRALLCTYGSKFGRLIPLQQQQFLNVSQSGQISQLLQAAPQRLIRLLDWKQFGSITPNAERR